MDKSVPFDVIQRRLEDLQQVKTKLIQHESELVALGKELDKKIRSEDLNYDALLKECNKCCVSSDVVRIQIDTAKTLKSLQGESEKLHSEVEELESLIEHENTAFDQLVCKFQEQMQQIRIDMVKERTNSTSGGAETEVQRIIQRSENLKSSVETKQREIDDLCSSIREIELSERFRMMSAEDFHAAVVTWEMIKAENESVISSWNDFQQSDSAELMTTDN